MNFANNIKMIRKENDLSQEQFAEKLGVSRQSVSKWESKQSYPEMDKILLICKLFDCDISELMNDNIQEIKETKQEKTRVSKAIEEFFDYITRFVEMFGVMTFKQKILCLLEQVVNIGILALISFIGYMVLDRILEGIFGLLNGAWFTGIIAIFSSIYIIVAIAISLSVLLHIFKIRYLDYYETQKVEPKIDEKDESNEENEEAEENGEDDRPSRKSIFSRKREKIIIRDPIHSSSKFLVSILKIVVTFLKVLLGLVGVCVALGFICFAALLIVSFVFAKTGILFVGAFLILGAMLAISFVILRQIYNFITSRKNRKGLTALILIISLAVSGVGVGLSFIGSTQFNVVEKHITAKTEFTVPMEDNLSVISYYCPVKYVVNDSDDVKIRVIHSKYSEVRLEDYDESVDVWVDDDTKVFERIRAIIADVNNKQINSYLLYNSVDKITVYSSKANIDKLRSNAKNNM